jgi:hypothetical protein
MTLRIKVRGPEGEMVEITDALDVTTLSVTENAEEGSVAISTITLDDPDMELEMLGHRSIEIFEDEIYGEENSIYRGYVADRTYARGRHPLGRELVISASDPNTVWQRRVMVGADCKRPAETDVARMQWLITTSEAGMIDDDTYLSTDDPVNMDACDYRGQMMGSVADDCAQASGKNWYVTHDWVNGEGFQIWYGHQSLEVYDSPLRLSNVESEIDDLVTFAISDDTTLNRDPSRVFSGVYVPYDPGAVYRSDADTVTAFARRDVVMPSLNVKSKTKAIARAVRYLADLDEETDRITTAVILPAAQVNDIRPGMRVLFRATHFPTYEADYRWLRVLSRTVAYWVPGQYRLSLVLDGPGTLDIVPPVSCGIDEVDAFAATYNNGDPDSSATTGPTLSLVSGKAYRLVAEVDYVVRPRIEAISTLEVSLNRYPSGNGSFSPSPSNPWLFQTYPAQGQTYYSDWYTYTGGASTAWIETHVGSVWSPGQACDFHVWVECV